MFREHLLASLFLSEFSRGGVELTDAGQCFVKNDTVEPANLRDVLQKNKTET